MSIKTKRKRILPAVMLLLVAGLGTLTYLRWGVWFGNPPEASYLPSFQPDRILLTFGNDGEYSRNVSWQCDTVLRPSHLEILESGSTDTLCVKAAGEIFVSRSGKAAYYVARLRHLRPGTNYRYRVLTHGRASRWYVLSMPTHDTPDFSFLYFGDVQDSLGGSTPRLFSRSIAQHPESHFVLFGGDLIERPTHTYWGEAFRAIDTIAGRQPILAVTGNHEYLKYPIRQLERRFSLTFSYFLQSMVGENQVYSLRYRDAQFYLLDSNRELPYLLTQKEWLENQMKRSTARWNIVVLHHPIYSIKGTTNNLMQRWVFCSLLNERADLVLQGHEHNYARMTQRDDHDNPTTPVYTVSHCSPKHYRMELSDRFDRYGCGTQYYQSIAFCGDTLRMTTYDAQTQQPYDCVDIVKPRGQRPQLIDRATHLPEKFQFTPRLGNKKDAQYQQRLIDYQSRHANR